MLQKMTQTWKIYLMAYTMSAIMQFRNSGEKGFHTRPRPRGNRFSFVLLLRVYLLLPAGYLNELFSDFLSSTVTSLSLAMGTVAPTGRSPIESKLDCLLLSLRYCKWGSTSLRREAEGRPGEIGLMGEREGGTMSEEGGGGGKVDRTRIRSVWGTTRSKSVLQISPIGTKNKINHKYVKITGI